MRAPKQLLCAACIVFVLFCSARTGEASLVLESTCNDLTQGLQAVLDACDVDALASLYRTTTYRGPALYCNAACTAAVKDLDEALPFCSTADTVLGITQVRTQIHAIRTSQAACNAPSIECLRAQRQFDTWLRTTTGAACAATLQSAATLPDTQDSQDQLRALCTGACNTGFAHYLQLLEQAECLDWDFYKLYRESVDLTCSTATTSTTSNAAQITYCRNQFNPELNRAQLSQAHNLTLSTEVRENVLSSICTPCFFEYLRVTAQQNQRPTEVAELEVLCVRDGDAFCYPSVADVVAFAQDAGPAQRGQQLCELGHCAPKMIARFAESPSLLVASQYQVAFLANTSTAHLTYMCLQTQEGDTCVEAMDSVIGGFDSDLAYVGAPFSGPSACEDIGGDDYCTWGCQRRLTSFISDVGCCHQSMRSYLAALGAGAAALDSAFSSIEVIATECNRPHAESCVAFNDNRGTVIDIPLPFQKSFLKQNEAVLLRELVVLLGRPAGSFRIRRISDDGSALATVQVMAYFENQDRLNQIRTSVLADISQGTTAFIHLMPLYYEQVVRASL